MGQQGSHVSDATQKIVDSEIKRFVEDGYDKAQSVIRENIDDLHTLALALLEYETLTGDEMLGLLEGQSPIRPNDDDADKPKNTGVPSAGKAKPKKKKSVGDAEDLKPQTDT
jgi:cell division protease FtsH